MPDLDLQPESWGVRWCLSGELPGESTADIFQTDWETAKMRWHPETLSYGNAGQMRMGISLWLGRNCFMTLIWTHTSPHWSFSHGGVWSRSPPLTDLGMFRVFSHYWLIKLRTLSWLETTRTTRTETGQSSSLVPAVTQMARTVSRADLGETSHSTPIRVLQNRNKWKK